MQTQKELLGNNLFLEETTIVIRTKSVSVST